MDRSCLKNGFGLYRIIPWLKYKFQFRRDHPDYFDPSGTILFCGMQGEGKSLSAVTYAYKLCIAYPKAILVTNMDLVGFPSSTSILQYVGSRSFSDIENGEHGVIYLIDELHLEFNSLESQKLSVNEMMEFAQQRKQRKHIIGTTQVYGRVAKPLREQVQYAILCRCFFGLFQANNLIYPPETTEVDGKVESKTRGRFWWFHDVNFYGMYDTYAKMQRIRNESEKRVLVGGIENGI